MNEYYAVGFDLMELCYHILKAKQQKEVIRIGRVYPHEVFRELIKHLRFKLEKDNIRYNKKKMRLLTKSYYSDVELEPLWIEITNSIVYYLKLQKNGKNKKTKCASSARFRK